MDAMRRLAKIFVCFLNKVKYKKKADIKLSATVLGKCKFEGKNAVGKKSRFVNSSLGYASYIGRNCSFSETRIGRYCSIGSDVAIVSSTHPTENMVSTHPSFFSKSYKNLSYVEKAKCEEILRDESGLQCEIGSDVWIGNKVLIKGGVKIGNGAVIGMGSVITKDVPPYAIVGGVPAKVIRYRADKETIEKLEKMQWWNNPEEWVRENAGLFCDLKAFIGEFGNENM